MTRALAHINAALPWIGLVGVVAGTAGLWSYFHAAIVGGAYLIAANWAGTVLAAFVPPEALPHSPEEAE